MRSNHKVITVNGLAVEYFIPEKEQYPASLLLFTAQAAGAGYGTTFLIILHPAAGPAMPSTFADIT